MCPGGRGCRKGYLHAILPSSKSNMKRTAITLSATDCALTPFSMAKIGHVTTVTGTRTCNLSFSIRMSGTHHQRAMVRSASSAAVSRFCR